MPINPSRFRPVLLPLIHWMIPRKAARIDVWAQPAQQICHAPRICFGNETDAMIS